MKRTNIGRFALVGLLGLVGVLVGGYFGMQRISTDVPPAPLGTLQQIELPDIDKRIRRGDEWLGKIVIVNHWATWCAPCREEIPMLIDYQHQMGGKGVQVVGIAHDLLDATRIFGDEIGLDYPSLLVIVGGNELLSLHGNTQSGALPFTAIFDRNGALVRTKLGKISRPELQALVAPLL